MLMPLNTLNLNIKKGVLHLGANIGEEAEMYNAADLHPVVWFECNPKVMSQLRLNVEPLGHYVIEAAVSDKNGDKVSFNITNNNASSSVLDLSKHSDYYPDIVVTEKVELTTRTVDSLLLQHKYKFDEFEFANLDLQGYELTALRGMIECLKHLKWIYTEVNTAELYTGCCLLEQLDEFLKSHGFTRQKISMTGMSWGDALYERVM